MDEWSNYFCFAANEKAAFAYIYVILCRWVWHNFQFIIYSADLSYNLRELKKKSTCLIEKAFFYILGRADEGSK